MISLYSFLTWLLLIVNVIIVHFHLELNEVDFALPFPSIFLDFKYHTE